MDIDGLRDRDHVLAFIAADHASAGERSAGLGLRLTLEGGTVSVDGKGLFFWNWDGRVMYNKTKAFSLLLDVVLVS